MLKTSDIERVLRTILDPEMPINIVDLGLIEDVRVERAGEERHAGTQARRHGGREARRHAGTEEEQARVAIDVTPTFVGCPALRMIEDMICEQVSDLPGVANVTVNFINDPPWSVERISEAGRAALRPFGVTVPPTGSVCGAADAPSDAPGAAVPLTVSGSPRAVACPFCGSESTHMESPFGPTRCKMIYYCDACRNTFEHLKPV